MAHYAIARALRSGLIAAPLLATADHSAVAQSSETPTILLVHGIAGSDLGPNTPPALPLDLAIDNACVKPATSFAGTPGPYPLAVGAHTVTLSPANTTSPCSNSALLSQSVTLQQGEQAAVVAAENTSGQPSLGTYDLTEGVAVPAGSARLVLFNTANAPAVNVALTNMSTNSTINFGNIAVGVRKATSIIPNVYYRVVVTPMNSTTPLAGPISISASNRAVDALFIVGSAAQNSVGLVRREIAPVF